MEDGASSERVMQPIGDAKPSSWVTAPFEAKDVVPEAEAPAHVLATDDPSRVWSPEVIRRFAAFMSPNEVACALRLVDKSAASALPAPEHSQVQLSLPVPHHAFVRRWGDMAILRTLGWKQRRLLLQLTAHSGCLDNLLFLLAMEDYFPLQPDVMEAAAGAGQLGVCQALRQRGCPWNRKVLGRAAAGGHLETCEWLLASGCSWSDDLTAGEAGFAVQGGHVALMDWLLAAAQAAGRGIAYAGLLRSVALGGDLSTLQRIHALCIERCREHEVRSWDDVLVSAATSPTADWQAKTDWLLARGMSRQ